MRVTLLWIETTTLPIKFILTKITKMLFHQIAIYQIAKWRAKSILSPFYIDI